MNSPIKHQLSQIVRHLAYKSYGFNINLRPSQVQLIPSSTSSASQRISFKIGMPQLIYQEYSKDGFIYSDPGTTPKQIADEMLVHFKELNHLEMDSDQFGNIKATLKHQYFQEKYRQMITYNKIVCFQCDQIKYAQNDTITKSNPHSGTEKNTKKNLFALFRQRYQSITLSELRQKFVLEVVRQIQTQIFLGKTQSIEINDQQSSVKGKPQSLKGQTQSLKSKQQSLKSRAQSYSRHNYDKIYFACLKHQIISKETILEQFFKLQNNKVLKAQHNKETADKFHPFKFGLVLPQSLHVKYPISQLQEQQLSKLRNIFYDNSNQRPIDLSKIHSVNSQFQLKLSHKLINLPANLQQLLFQTQEMLSNYQITKMYHMYLVLAHFLNTQNTNNLLDTNSSTSESKYINAAKIIKDHFERLLFHYETL